MDLVDKPIPDYQLSTDERRADFVVGLRALADLIEKHPELAGNWPSVCHTVWPADREGMAVLGRQLGSARKEDTDTVLRLRKHLSSTVTLDIDLAKQNSCVRTQVGTEEHSYTLAAGVKVEQTEDGSWKVVEERPVYEYDCGGPLLAGG